MQALTPESTGESVSDDRPEVERLRRGDRDALGELYGRHAGTVYWNAYGVLKSRPDAEEMTADAFLTLWTRRHEVEIYGISALPWLVVTVKNLSRNRLRSNERRSADHLDDVDPASAGPSAEDLAALDEAMRLVREVISQLPAVDQEIFRLCMVDGLTYKEAAAKLGLKHGSVRNRLSRMRLRLQSELGPRS
ncbi:RNA polymerase sigma factor (sigma-70 family) [Leifsonia sp. EB41]|uniref:RNA polymerase sigma factor n=1 Tax=Leifsonia sp. EB41 TaxID=3156260 RepID=UPI003515EC33